MPARKSMIFLIRRKMAPSPEFYQEVREHKYDKTINDWKKACFTNKDLRDRSLGAEFFLCRVQTPNGKSFYAVLETRGDKLGAGNIYIPIGQTLDKVGQSGPVDMQRWRVTQGRRFSFNKNNVGLIWMTEANNQQFTIDTTRARSSEIYRELGLEQNKYVGDIQCDMGGSLDINDALRFQRDITWKDDRFRKEWKGVSKAGSAYGLATRFEQTFPGWKVTPIKDAPKYMKSEKSLPM